MWDFKPLLNIVILEYLNMSLTPQTISENFILEPLLQAPQPWDHPVVTAACEKKNIFNELLNKVLIINKKRLGVNDLNVD